MTTQTNDVGQLRFDVGDIGREGYRGPAVCKIVGVSYRQLDYWARTGLVEPTVRNSANPPMLRAGYKVNVIPAVATARVDGRVLPGTTTSSAPPWTSSPAPL